MKILFLLPPSEGKNSQGEIGEEKLSFNFEKPKEIATNVTQKDLKCTGSRFEEWVNLNKQLCETKDFIVTPAINRYSGVMYNAIDYAGMDKDWKKYFEENFLIFSWMYWIVKASDLIGNYKLPIETKTLAKYWQETITNTLNESSADYVINLLPLSYQKMIDFKCLSPKLVNINFQVEKNGKIVKMAHWVKKIKGEWIKNICETLWSLYLSGEVSEGEEIFRYFGGEKIQTEKSIEINILHK
mgnify:CR=1 FL=1